MAARQDRPHDARAGTPRSSSPEARSAGVAALVALREVAGEDRGPRRGAVHGLAAGGHLVADRRTRSSRASRRWRSTALVLASGRRGRPRADARARRRLGLRDHRVPVVRTGAARAHTRPRVCFTPPASRPARASPRSARSRSSWSSPVRVLVVLGLRGDAPPVLDRRRDPPAVLVLPLRRSRPVRRRDRARGRRRSQPAPRSSRVAARGRDTRSRRARRPQSGMSKGEVERIWLPFVPWAVLATAALSVGRPSARLRPWLGLQAACALVVAVSIWSQW